MPPFPKPSAAAPIRRCCFLPAAPPAPVDWPRPTIPARPGSCPTRPPARISDVHRHAERLAEAGLLARSFFDRLHVCPACRSSRLNVREECPACRGSSIAEEATVHHFACAQMALERAFLSGDGLVCPKCRTRLRHFGIDYEKPGVATVCNGCGHVDGEPAVGFRCVDCGAHHDAQTISLRDWFSYALTPAGEEALARGALVAGSPTPPAQTQTLLLLLRQGLASATRSRPMAAIGVSFAGSLRRRGRAWRPSCRPSPRPRGRDPPRRITRCRLRRRQ